MDSRIYFAAEGKDEIGKALVGRLEDCALKDAGERMEMYRLAYGHLYGFDNGDGSGSTHRVMKAGKGGQLSRVRVNNARALLKALVSIVIGPKLSWRPQAANGDPEAAAACILASNVLEWYVKKRGLGRVGARWVFQATGFADSFIFNPWDEELGDDFASVDEEGQKTQLVKAGDVAFHNVLPWDVTIDPTASSYEDCNWWFVRLYKNKWDLASLFPKAIDGTAEGKDSKELILGMGGQVLERMAGIDISGSLKRESSDLIPVYYFFHRRTATLPQGREAVFVSSECVLRDRPLRYQTVPVHRLAADEMFGTPRGYSSFWDALGVQELRDGLQSSVASNLLALSTQSIAAEKGSEIQADRASGLKVLWYKPGARPPEALQLAKSPPEIFGHMEALKAEQRGLMQLNDTAMGDPAEKLSGAAYALLKSSAIQNNSPFQADYVEGMSRVGTSTLQSVTEFATEERKVEITGKGSQYLYTDKAFKGSDLKAVQSVFVEIGNPLEQTSAGRFELAQIFIAAAKEAGQAIPIEQLQAVLDTGRMEPIVKSMRAETMLIEAENEQILRGEVPPVHAFHNHLRHAPENASMLSNPDGLRDPKVVAAAQAHVDWHYREYFGVDPKVDMERPQRMRILLGQVPAPPPGAASGMPPPMPGAAPPPGAAGEVLEEPAPQEQLDGAAMPNMPTNPLTGQEFNELDGGGVVPS